MLTINQTVSKVALLLSLVLMFDATAESFRKYKQHTRFDSHFRKYSKRYFGVAFNWHYFKAQAVAESNLNPDAQSRVGAQGIMQIMPSTYAEIQRKHRVIDGGVMEPRWNIAAAIWYNKTLFDFWRKDRTLIERLRFMFASYNAGKGNLLKAQRQAINVGLNPRQWHSVRQVLNKVTGKHSRETIGYVDRIEQVVKEIQ